MTLPDEELDAIERCCNDTIPDHHVAWAVVTRDMRKLVAEVRRLRAGSVSEYQPAGWRWRWEDANSDAHEAWHTEDKKPPPRTSGTWFARVVPVWVRKEDAT